MTCKRFRENYPNRPFIESAVVKIFANAKGETKDLGIRWYLRLVFFPRHVLATFAQMGAYKLWTTREEWGDLKPDLDRAKESNREQGARLHKQLSDLRHNLATAQVENHALRTAIKIVGVAPSRSPLMDFSASIEHHRCAGEHARMQERDWSKRNVPELSHDWGQKAAIYERTVEWLESLGEPFTEATVETEALDLRLRTTLEALVNAAEHWGIQCDEVTLARTVLGERKGGS
ncbi:MAG: hypothetical protein EON58_02240 [Alphaproteobacteria bacterium]|nr:MAG: hypothetical protein EON58_02240 [Alphaproteobacteria bacterium]